MNIFGKHNGFKRKCKHGKEKGKKKSTMIERFLLLLSKWLVLEQILPQFARSHQKAEMSIDKYVSELLSSGPVDDEVLLHLFALWILRVKENGNSYFAVKTPHMRFKFVKYCFEHNNQSFPHKG